MAPSHTRGGLDGEFGKNFFKERVAKARIRVGTEMGESPSLDLFEKHTDVALEDMG